MYDGSTQFDIVFGSEGHVSLMFAYHLVQQCIYYAEEEKPEVGNDVLALGRKSLKGGVGC